LLKQQNIGISMSRKGNPYDNAKCESFMKTLKYEEVHRQEYRDSVSSTSITRSGSTRIGILSAGGI
jgi:transposase InsO family protein